MRCTCAPGRQQVMSSLPTGDELFDNRWRARRQVTSSSTFTQSITCSTVEPSPRKPKTWVLPLSSECGTHKTVKTRFWPWLSGQSPYNLFSCSRLARELPSQSSKQPVSRRIFKETYCIVAVGCYLLSIYTLGPKSHHGGVERCKAVRASGGGRNGKEVFTF